MNRARSRPCLYGHDRASEEPKGVALHWQAVGLENFFRRVL